MKDSPRGVFHYFLNLLSKKEKLAYRGIPDEDMEKAFNGCMSLCDLVIYRIGGRERSGEDRTCKVEI